MANALQWSRFETAFKKLKRKHHFRIFHTKKFRSKSGDFRNWTNERCLALRDDLAELSSRAFMEAVSLPLDKSDFERDYRAGEKPRRMRLDSAYGFCFRQCLTYLVMEVLRRTSDNREHQLHIVLENGHKNSEDARRVFNEMKAWFESEGIRLLATFTTAEKDECDPLMVADFIAHSSYLSDLKQRAGVPSLVGNKTPRKTGIMHLEFTDGGLAKERRKQIAHFEALRRGVSPFSGQTLS